MNNQMLEKKIFSKKKIFSFIRQIEMIAIKY